MSLKKLTEEQLNKISADVVAAVMEKKAEGNLDDAETKTMLEKMVQDQVKLAQEKSMIQRNTDLEDADFSGQDNLDEDAKKAALELEFKAVNALDPKERLQIRDSKMLMSEKRLGYRHGTDIGQRIEEFKRLNDDAYLIATMLRGAAVKAEAPVTDLMGVYKGTDVYQDVQNYLANDKEVAKALAVATSGSGSQWIPTGFSSQVLLSIELQLQIPTLFNTIAMPTSPYTLPVQSSMGEAYLIPESTTDEATKIKTSTPGTSNSTFTARKLATRTLFSEEINEDSIVAIRTFTINEIAKSIARGHETAIINGDRTGAAGSAASHQDNATADLFTSDYDARLAFDGLRYFALNQADTSTKDFGNAVPTDALMNAVRLLTGKHGTNPRDLAWIPSVNTYLQMIGNLTNVQTLNLYGPNAVVLSGELMKYQGIPVVVSEYMFSNLNATGVYDASTTDRSQVLLVYRPGFLNGTRGGVTLATANDIETDQVILVGKRRVDFIDPYGATTTGNVQVALGMSVKTT